MKQPYRVTCAHDADIVFTYSDVTFYGSNANSIDMFDHCLIVNCGAQTKKGPGSPFAFAPKWFNSKPHYSTVNNIDEMYINWPDFGVPHLSHHFWVDLMDSVTKDLQYKHVVFTCDGGHGRTGTGLCAMLITLGWRVREAIIHVRETYCEKAVESDDQIKYLCHLSLNINDFIEPQKELLDEFDSWARYYNTSNVSIQPVSSSAIDKLIGWSGTADLKAWLQENKSKGSKWIFDNCTNALWFEEMLYLADIDVENIATPFVNESDISFCDRVREAITFSDFVKGIFK